MCPRSSALVESIELNQDRVCTEFDLSIASKEEEEGETYGTELIVVADQLRTVLCGSEMMIICSSVETLRRMESGK